MSRSIRRVLPVVVFGAVLIVARQITHTPPALGANDTFTGDTGPATTTNMNQVQHVSGSSELGSQINAAGSSLSRLGGTIVVDPGFYTLSTQVTALETASEPVDLVIMPGAKIDVTATGENCEIPIGNGSGVEELGGPISTNGGSTEGFYIGAAASLTDLFCNADTTGAQELLHINGTHVVGASGETITGAIYELQGLFVNTVLRDNYTQNISTASGTVRVLRVSPGTSRLKLASDLTFDNDNFDCTGSAGCIATDIEGVTGSTVSGLAFVGGAIQHGGSGEPTLIINGNGTANGIYAISFYRVHLEARAGGDPCAFQITDASHITFDNPEPTGSATNAFCISQSRSGLTHAIGLTNVRAGGGYTDIINNLIDSYTNSSRTIPSYYYAWPVIYDASALTPAKYTVSTLPSASTWGAGATVLVTDAATFTVGACTGGGSDTMIAVSNGTSWSCH